jgi:hypothetical protein
MNCVMAKHVNRYLFLPLISFLMIMSAFVLALIYFSIYKATKESLKQRLKENEENYIEQHNKLNKSYRYKRVLVISLHAKKVHEKEIKKLQISIRFLRGLLFISIIFFTTCVPLSSVQIIDEFYTLPSYLHLYTFLLTRLCSLFNPLFYGLYSSTFLFGYKNVLNVIIHRKRLNFREYEEERNKANKKRLNFKKCEEERNKAKK